MPHSRLAARAAALLALAVAVGCALRARGHPCYPYLAARYRGHVPPEILRGLGRERGARRTIGRLRAPAGFYWRPAPPGSVDLQEVRTLADGHELAPCPGMPVAPAQ